MSYDICHVSITEHKPVGEKAYTIVEYDCNDGPIIFSEETYTMNMNFCKDGKIIQKSNQDEYETMRKDFEEIYNSAKIFVSRGSRNLKYKTLDLTEFMSKHDK